MQLAPGVVFITRSEQAQCITQLMNPQFDVYVINTFCRPEIDSLPKLKHALAITLGLSEWFGYPIDVLIKMGIQHKRLSRLVLVLTPLHFQLLTGELVHSLATASNCNPNFQTLIFDTSLAQEYARF